MTNSGESNREEAAAPEVVEEEKAGGLQPAAEAGREGSLDDEVFDDKRKTKKKKDKVKQAPLVPIQQLEKLHLESKKKRRSSRPLTVPFPYAYDDPAVAKGCYPSCLSPPPVADDLPLGENPKAATAKPSRSSYHGFLKSLLEKNDFYSNECNAHRDVRQPKPPGDKKD